MDIIDSIDVLLLSEREFRKVIRKGKLKRKLFCPPGFKAVDGKCTKMNPKEMLARKLGTKQRVRTLKGRGGTMMKAKKKRAKSMRKRAMMIPMKGLPSATPETEGE